MWNRTSPKPAAWPAGPNQPTNKIIMHQINEIFFEYIFLPTAAVAYVVFVWGFIGWAIKSWLEERREKKDAKNKQGGDAK